MEGWNMNKIKFLLSVLLAAGMSSSVFAQTVSQQLPPAETSGGMPILTAMSNRQSGKNFSSQVLEPQTLSNILWAAWGINRSDGKRTIPTAMNNQNMLLYVIKADGAWLYNAQEQSLQPVSSQDLRPYLATQAYAENAPLFLLYAVNEGSADIVAGMQAGSMYQDVALYCASQGLNNVVRGYFDKASLAAALGIAEEQIVVSQVIGKKSV